MDCDCDNVIGRLKNDQPILELVKLHSWDLDDKIKQTAFTVLGSKVLAAVNAQLAQGRCRQEYSDLC